MSCVMSPSNRLIFWNAITLKTESPLISMTWAMVLKRSESCWLRDMGEECNRGAHHVDLVSDLLFCPVRGERLREGLIARQAPNLRLAPTARKSLTLTLSPDCWGEGTRSIPLALTRPLAIRLTDRVL